MFLGLIALIESFLFIDICVEPANRWFLTADCFCVQGLTRVLFLNPLIGPMPAVIGLDTGTVAKSLLICVFLEMLSFILCLGAG
jgi:hypothetical protein